MLKIISANVNGIRSAYKKGFYEYIATSGADIVCVQELKAQEADLSDDMKNPHGMHGYWHCAEKRGYSGVAVYSKRKPDNVQIGMGIEEIRPCIRVVQSYINHFHCFSLCSGEWLR